MTLPNKLTILRIILIPFLLFFYLFEVVPYAKLIACAIFIIAIFTDFLDGYLARKYNLITDLGKFLDPIADKMVVTAGLLLLVADQTIPAPYGVLAIFVILARDFIVGVLRQMAATKKTVIAADKLGKFKTLTQDIAIIFLFILAYNNSANLLTTLANSIFTITAYAILAISVLLTIISGINYVVKNKKLIG
jgi:CDP-diacylglycerol--glycerol-3-phosphate 3-phosphatidyltransferase